LRWATGQDQLRNFAGDIALFAWFAVSFTTADYRSSPPRGYPILALKVSEISRLILIQSSSTMCSKGNRPGKIKAKPA
jgi:hypothetical protein